MAAVAGILFTDVLGKPKWFEAGAQEYWMDNNALLAIEFLVLGFLELKRFQGWKETGTSGFLNAFPFDPAGECFLAKGALQTLVSVERTQRQPELSGAAAPRGGTHVWRRAPWQMLSSSRRLTRCSRPCLPCARRCRHELPLHGHQGGEERPPRHGRLHRLLRAGKRRVVAGRLVAWPIKTQPASAFFTVHYFGASSHVLLLAACLPRPCLCPAPGPRLLLTTLCTRSALCPQALVTREGPVEALQSHLSSPFENNFIGSIAALPSVIGK